MKKRIFTLLMFCLVLNASADVDVSIGVVTDGDANIDTTFVAGGQVTSNHNFYANGVELYFNGIKLEDYTPEKEIRVETNRQAALGAFSSTLRIMADYRTGESRYISVQEANMLKSFMRLTNAEIQQYHDTVTEKELNKLREFIYDNMDQILVNMGYISKNREGIAKINHVVYTLGYQVEAQDLALRRMDKDAYCNALIEVMKEYGFKRVRCDVNSRLCYNGQIFDWEGGRDFCYVLDEMDMKPSCVREGNCPQVWTIRVTTTNPPIGTDTPEDTPFLTEIGFSADVRNPSHYPVKVYGRAEIYGLDGEIVESCAFDMQEVQAYVYVPVYGVCETYALTEGVYNVRLTVGSEGVEIFEDVNVYVRQPHIIPPKNEVEFEPEVCVWHEPVHEEVILVESPPLGRLMLFVAATVGAGIIGAGMMTLIIVWNRQGFRLP